MVQFWHKFLLPQITLGPFSQIFVSDISRSFFLKRHRLGCSAIRRRDLSEKLRKIDLGCGNVA